jgi:protease I
MNDRQLTGKKIAILAADGVEEIEYRTPKEAVEAAGATTELLSLQPGVIQAMNHDIEPASKIPVDKAVADASPDDYDGLIIPGGTVNPDHLRQDRQAITFIQDYLSRGKPAGVICHGPWVLAEADVIRGRTLTSYPSIRTDLRNAGAIVVDSAVVVDQGLVTSRGPDDLPAFCAKIVEEFAQDAHRAAASGTGG